MLALAGAEPETVCVCFQHTSAACATEVGADVHIRQANTFLGVDDKTVLVHNLALLCVYVCEGRQKQ